MTDTSSGAATGPGPQPVILSLEPAGPAAGAKDRSVTLSAAISGIARRVSPSAQRRDSSSRVKRGLLRMTPIRRPLSNMQTPPSPGSGRGLIELHVPAPHPAGTLARPDSLDIGCGDVPRQTPIRIKAMGSKRRSRPLALSAPESPRAQPAVSTSLKRDR